jgi:hypothetical protein
MTYWVLILKGCGRMSLLPNLTKTSARAASLGPRFETTTYKIKDK